MKLFFEGEKWGQDRRRVRRRREGEEEEVVVDISDLQPSKRLRESFGYSYPGPMVLLLALFAWCLFESFKMQQTAAKEQMW